MWLMRVCGSVRMSMSVRTREPVLREQSAPMFSEDITALVHPASTVIRYSQAVQMPTSAPETPVAATLSVVICPEVSSVRVRQEVSETLCIPVQVSGFPNLESWIYVLSIVKMLQQPILLWLINLTLWWTLTISRYLPLKF